MLNENEKLAHCKFIFLKSIFQKKKKRKMNLKKFAPPPPLVKLKLTHFLYIFVY